MKIKNNLKLDFKKRLNYVKFELPINLIKLITNNKILNNNIRNKKGIILNNCINYTTKIRKACVFTGRMRGNITNYKLNRTQLKLLINDAKIDGLKNSSW